MHIKSFRVSNFRRLKDVRVDLEEGVSIFVGANNSGKTSATHVFQKFLGTPKGDFSIYDFTADCWSTFNAFGAKVGVDTPDLPKITLDIWFDVDQDNIHRVKDLIPSLDWDRSPVGIRLEYRPKDPPSILANYNAARARIKPQSTGPDGQPSVYKPWPENLTDYLTKRLRAEYEIGYSILDFTQMDGDLRPIPGYTPREFAVAQTGGARVLESLLRVDFMNAQRHLSDLDSKGRSEELSKKLSRFYSRNLEKLGEDHAALDALANAEARLNDHFATVFADTLESLRSLGYPGFANPDLIIKTSFKAESILQGNANIHYAIPGMRRNPDEPTLTLPDQYNGLGFKNLIFMVIEVLDFHHSWAAIPDDRPPVHLIMIEEPESHLHAQLQQVFIRKVMDVLPSLGASYQTQMIVTTHSAHIVYESFKQIRYFRRTGPANVLQYTDVRDLSRFYDNEEAATRDFLLQYFKLTHCDLFFADAAILVEGNVERLLVPLMITKVARNLEACHLTLLEVGGAFAHKFRKLITFLDLTTLVITDLDSVRPHKEPMDEESVEESDGRAMTACMADEEGAVTSNETLKSWMPGLSLVADLLALADEGKNASDSQNVRVAYQTLERSRWRTQEANVAGRTFEEAFALQNLAWTQDVLRRHLKLRVVKKNVDQDLDQVRKLLFDRVRTLDKTQFALGLMSENAGDWDAPQYIAEGLRWLSERLQPDHTASPTPMPLGGTA